MGLISSWIAQRCGIALYTKALTEALAKQDVESYIVPIHRIGTKDPDYFRWIGVKRLPLNVDLFHIQGEYGLFQNNQNIQMLYEWVKGLEKPVVSTMHAVGFQMDADALIAEYSDKVIVHNEACQKVYKHPSIIIPHGCPTVDLKMSKAEAREKMGLKHVKKLVAVHGFISEYKGYAEVIEAVGKLGKDVSLVIAGGFLIDVVTPIQDQLMALANRVAKDRVFFTGYIPEERVTVALQAADLVVNNHQIMTESGALCKVLGHGRATLAKRLRPTIEKEKQGALMCFDNQGDMEGKMRGLLDNPSMAEKLERGAMKYAKENSWNNVASLHVKLYQELIESGKKDVKN